MKLPALPRVSLSTKPSVSDSTASIPFKVSAVEATPDCDTEKALVSKFAVP